MTFMHNNFKAIFLYNIILSPFWMIIDEPRRIGLPDTYV